MTNTRARLAAFCLLSALAAAPAQAQDLPFLGAWDCGVAVFTFTPTTYNNGSEDLPIEEVQEGTDGSWTLLMPDDYAVTLSGITDTEMGWYSHASGDNFACTRVEG